jgi:prolyl 4-hydroxylase
MNPIIGVPFILFMLSLRTIVVLSIAAFSIATLMMASYLPGAGPMLLSRSSPPHDWSTSAKLLPPPRQPSLPRCSAAFPGDGDGLGATERPPCQFFVRNQQMDNAELLFVADGGEERRYFIVDYNSSIRVHSYTGDRWRLRSRHGTLLREFHVPACDGRTPPEVLLVPCTQAEQTPPTAPRASAETVHAFTAERLRRCGTERALSSEHASPGMHLLCLLPVPSVLGAAFAVAVFAHGLRNAPASGAPVPTRVFYVPAPPTPPPRLALASDPSAADIDPGSLIAFALAELERPLKKPRPHQPAAIFSLGGVRIDDSTGIARALSARQGLLLFEGGQWLWPTAFIGQEHTISVGGGMAAKVGHGRSSDGDTRVARLRVLSVRPRVLEVDDFLDDAECAHIIGLSESHMHKSGVSMKEDDAKAGRRSDEYRTSTQYSLMPSQTDTLLALSRRVQRLTRLPIEHTEQLQVLRYLPSQHYAAHHDFFDPADYGSSSGSSRKEQGLAQNRLATVFFYLNDVPRGGETGFPRAGGLEQPKDFRDCKIGMAVRPQKRRVVIFYSMLPSGEFDHYSLHAGCDVGANATKWAANFWMWNTPQQSTLLHRSLLSMAADLRDQRAEAELGEPPVDGSETLLPGRKSRFDRF